MVVEAEAQATIARRNIAGFETELRSRVGEDAGRLERIAVAEQLRTQVTAVERTLARAEREARETVEAAFAAASAADVAWDKAEGAVERRASPRRPARGAAACLRTARDRP